MSIKPCRYCGNPVHGTRKEARSLCCSRRVCINKDLTSDLTWKDEPLKTLPEKKFNNQIKKDLYGQRK